MMILDQSHIKQVLDIDLNLLSIIAVLRNELIHFSNGHTISPTPMYLQFQAEHGECHIKSGYNSLDDFFVIKIATGFYNNSKFDLPASDGLFALICKKTGLIKVLLCDGGYLTNVRTAVTACLAASLTPWQIDTISVVGTGQLAKLIIKLMHQLYPNVPIKLWGRDAQKVMQIQKDYPAVIPQHNLSTLVQEGGVIFTTTASQTPLILQKDILEKTHLIALGADEPNKIEIESSVFSIADQVMVDARKQAILYGNTALAIQKKQIDDAQLIEIGEVLRSFSELKENKSLRGLQQQPLLRSTNTYSQVHERRKNTVGDLSQLLISDFTGIAAQDIGIAKFIYKKIACIDDAHILAEPH